MLKKQVKAGVLPEQNLAEMQTQLANDSANFIAAKSNYALALLQLKALLNLDAATPFDIELSISTMPVEPLAELESAIVYAYALNNLPEAKISALNVKAAEKNVLIAKSVMYPTVNAFGGLSSRYSNAQKYIANNFQMEEVPIGVVNVNGTNYTAYTLQSQPVGFDKNNYFRQLSNNFGQNVGIGLSIPIFNGGAARTNWKKAQLSVETQRLNQEQDTQKLQQDIYQIHESAIAAVGKYEASKIAVESAQKAYDFASKRFEAGLIKPIDIIINQNNLFRAKINMLSAQYDSIFKLKLLEFYKGKGLHF